VYQLIGFFSVFQGVVLTAVSQSSLLYCHNKWSPIALSVLASVISTFGVIQKLNQINDLQRNVDQEERDFAVCEYIVAYFTLQGLELTRLQCSWVNGFDNQDPRELILSS
jgi:hypothetical protein